MMTALRFVFPSAVITYTALFWVRFHAQNNPENGVISIFFLNKQNFKKYR